MGGALDQSARSIEELVRNPLKGYSPMRTAVFVDKDPVALAYRENRLALMNKASAAWIGQVVQATKGAAIQLIKIIHDVIIGSAGL